MALAVLRLPCERARPLSCPAPDPGPPAHPHTSCPRWNAAAEELYTGADDCNIVVWAPPPEPVTAEREAWQAGLESDGDAWSD